MKEKLAWLRWPLEHYSITLVIIGILFVLGIFGMYRMPKDEFPQFTIRQGVVVAVYPGATSEEVEQQVARPLERYLFTYGEVRREKTTTTSQNGMCIVMVELNDNVTNKDEVWSKIKHGLNNFKQSLPSGVLALVVNDDFGSTSALLIAMESKIRSPRELEDYAQTLSDRLRRIKSVSNVRLYGQRQEQISLYVDREKMEAYGIGRQMLFSQLQAQGLTTMSGSISNNSRQVPIHIEAASATEEDVANQIIYSAAGTVVRVRDIATVVREYDNSESYIEQDGNPCILLSMEMTAGNNIVQYGHEVDEVLDSFRADELPDDVTITRIADQPKVVAGSVNSFLRDLLISMAIIILVMMLLFPLRSAIVAAITIPLSTFISVAIMYLAGIELNIVTLAALIIVLGMVVDNSIVVIDGYLEYLGKGYEPKKAAFVSAQQYFMPMMLATICICTIFFPLIFTLTGAGHDAMLQFPPTITINLMVSLLLAVTVIPFLEVKIIKPEKMTSAKDGERLTDKIQKLYEKVLSWTFRRPWLTIGIGVAVILVSCLLAFTLKLRQFPFADRDQFAVEFFFPEGKSLDDAREIADSVRVVLQADPDVKCITSFIGCSSPRFMTCYAPQIAGKNYAQFIVNTTSAEASLALLAKYQPLFSDAFSQAYIKFKRMDYLPVSELEYRFYGEDVDSLQLAAENMMARMRELPELEWVHTDWLQPYPVLNVRLDPVASAQMGISKAAASLNLTSSTGDLPLGSIWEDDYELPIVLKNKEDLNFSDVANLGMAAPAGMLASGLNGNAATVPLRQIATVQPEWSQSKIVHRNGERCITVTAQFKNGVYAGPIESHLTSVMENEIYVPSGVRTESGGEKEFEGELIPGIFSGVAIAMVIVFFFLLFNFKKYGITTICIVALGFMIPGTLVGLALMNKMLGLTSVMGVITLIGMIMRNEILIFEHANDLVAKWVAEHPGSLADADYRRAYNENVRAAAYDAGRRRMVPIFLTTATTAVGVVPMIIAASSFWMPVGVTIFAGGIGSLIMVVTMLPVIYWKVNLK